MKKLLTAIFAFMFVCSMSISAQNVFKAPEKLVQVTKSNVNIREAGNPSAPVLYKAPMGTVFEFVSQNGQWYEVKEAVTGKIVYVSSTVSQILSEDNENYYHTLELNLADSGIEYAVMKSDKDGEVKIAYTFEYCKNNQLGECLKATQSIRFTSMSGRSRTNETTYLGYQKGWYLEFLYTEDYEGNLTKLEKPMIFYGAGMWSRILNNDGVDYSGQEMEMY